MNENKLGWAQGVYWLLIDGLVAVDQRCGDKACVEKATAYEAKCIDNAKKQLKWFKTLLGKDKDHAEEKFHVRAPLHVPSMLCCPHAVCDAPLSHRHTCASNTQGSCKARSTPRLEGKRGWGMSTT